MDKVAVVEFPAGWDLGRQIRMYAFAVDGQRKYGGRLYLQPGSHEIEFVLRHRRTVVGVRKLSLVTAAGRNYVVRAELVDKSLVPYGWQFNYWIEDKVDGQRVAEGVDPEISDKFTQRTWYFDGGPNAEPALALEGEPAKLFVPWGYVVTFHASAQPNPIDKYLWRYRGESEWELRPGDITIEVKEHTNTCSNFWRTTVILQPGRQYELRASKHSWTCIMDTEAQLYDKADDQMVAPFSQCLIRDSAGNRGTVENFYACEEQWGAEVVYR